MAKQMKSKTGNKAHVSSRSSPAACPLGIPPAIMQHQQCFSSIYSEKYTLSSSVFQANHPAIGSQISISIKSLYLKNISSPVTFFRQLKLLHN